MLKASTKHKSWGKKNRLARQSQIDGSESDRKLLGLRIVCHETTSRWGVQSQIDGSERDQKLLHV